MNKIPPSQRLKQDIHDLMDGAKEGEGAQLLSQLVRLSTENVLQQMLEDEQTQFLQRDRYERGQDTPLRNGYKPATLKTAEGVLRLQKPQIRGADTPYRSSLFKRLSTKSEVLQHMVTEMWVRGLSVRDVEETLLAATGSFVLSDTA